MFCVVLIFDTNGSAGTVDDSWLSCYHVIIGMVYINKLQISWAKKVEEEFGVCVSIRYGTVYQCDVIVMRYAMQRNR